MKTILLYGPGEAGKRNELLRIKSRFSRESAVTVDCKEGGEGELKMALSSPSLFESGPRLVVIEHAPEKMDVRQFKSSEESLTLLIMGGNLKSASTLLQSAKEAKAEIYSFEGEGEILAFPYLDSLIERKRGSFVELEKLLAEYGGVYILTMIFYLLRRNFLPSASAFVQKKVGYQRSLYRDEDWAGLYRMALEAEFKIKSGAVPERESLVYLTQLFISGQTEP